MPPAPGCRFGLPQAPETGISKTPLRGVPGLFPGCSSRVPLNFLWFSGWIASHPRLLLASRSQETPGHHSYVRNGRDPTLVGGLRRIGLVAARVAARGFWSWSPLHSVVDRDQNVWGCHRRHVGVDESVRNGSPIR